MRCSTCGVRYEWNYCIENKGNCFTCQFWLNRIEYDKPLAHAKSSVIVDHVAYRVCDEDVRNSCRGHGGAKWTIKFNDGRNVVSTNLWCQGEIPRTFWKLLPNNAVFVQ
jgi:hypothetical protein